MKRISIALGGVEVRWRLSQGAFRISTAADNIGRTSLVHLDGTDWSGVIHLSRTPTQGTFFYRHKELGLEYVGIEDDARPEVIAALKRDTLNLAAWEVTQVIPARYNRLVVFDGHHFHSGAQRESGVTLAEGRLTQNFFFHTVERDAASKAA
jgi:hypothetical protein